MCVRLTVPSLDSEMGGIETSGKKWIPEIAKLRWQTFFTKVPNEYQNLPYFFLLVINEEQYCKTRLFFCLKVKISSSQRLKLSAGDRRRPVKRAKFTNINKSMWFSTNLWKENSLEHIICFPIYSGPVFCGKILRCCGKKGS